MKNIEDMTMQELVDLNKTLTEDIAELKDELQQHADERDYGYEPSQGTEVYHNHPSEFEDHQDTAEEYHESMGSSGPDYHRNDAGEWMCG